MIKLPFPRLFCCNDDLLLGLSMWPLQAPSPCLSASSFTCLLLKQVDINTHTPNMITTATTERPIKMALLVVKRGLELSAFSVSEAGGPRPFFSGVCAEDGGMAGDGGSASGGGGIMVVLNGLPSFLQRSTSNYY